MLEISRLSLSLGQQTLLRDLSLTLHPGQVHVIIGPNGTGKTSLMRTLFGELTPDSGDIRLGDQSARQMTQARWRQQFGYMPQNIQLELDLSVIEVVVLGRLDSLSMRLADEDILAAGRALQALGIAHLAERVTHRLSGGEKRLVCLAGLLAMRPEVLLLDEPTNGVDAANGARLRAALAGFDGAMILVSHDEGFVAELATRALLIADGRLTEAEIHTHPHLHAHPHLHPHP